MSLFPNTEIECREELYMVFCGKKPRIDLIKVSCDKLSDSEFSELQDFVGGNQQIATWTTNIGVMEAIDNLIVEARANGNID